MKTALTILQQQFRFPSFRAGQSEIIENILEGKNVLAVMPTGSGKSLTYQILSLLLDGVTVVISPLIALMKDQVDFAYEIKEGWATFINSSIPYALQEKRTREILEGKYRLVYIAPERLRSRKFINALKFMNISLLVIDEAHCISFWGHDFRPDYLYIKEARKRIKNHKILALTATATPNIQDEIIKELNIEKPFKVVLGFDRPNLKLEVINTPTIKDKYEKLLSRIKELNGSGIIYTGTRQEAEEVDQFLQNLSIESAYYHAGLERERRARVQDDFMSDRVRIISATNAFGMGIDKSDIRFIIHWRIPSTLESYYQEIGRAGRDGEGARVTLFFSPDDQALQTRFITTDLPSIEELKALSGVLKNYEKDGAVVVKMDRLELESSLDNTKLRVGISLMEKVNIVKRYLDTSETGTIELKEDIPGLRSGMLDLWDLSVTKSKSIWDIEDWLWDLAYMGKINFYPQQRSTTLFVSHREIEKKWEILENEVIRRLKERKFSNLQSMIDYGRAFECRRYTILKYFGDISAKTRCDFCDNCLIEEEETEGEITLDYIIPFLKVVKNHRLGQVKIVQILWGSKTKSLRFTNTKEESYYGKFRRFNQDFLSQKMKFLFNKCYINKTVDEYPVLVISEKGEAVLGNQISGLMKSEIKKFNQDFEPEVKLREVKIPVDGLFQRLREWRFGVARKKGIPAYCVLHDKTIKEISRNLPLSVNELGKIKGIGAEKLRQYSEEIIDIIAQETRKEETDSNLIGGLS